MVTASRRAGQVHDRRRNTQKVALVGMHDVQRQADCHAGIDGIPTLPQNVQADHGSARVARDDDSVGTLDQRAQTGQGGSGDGHAGLLPSTRSIMLAGWR